MDKCDFERLLINVGGIFNNKYFMRAIVHERPIYLCGVEHPTEEMYKRINWGPSEMSEYDGGQIILDVARHEVRLTFDIFTDDDEDELEMEMGFALTQEETKEFFAELDNRCKIVKWISFDDYIEHVKDRSTKILADEAREKAIRRYIRKTDSSGVFEEHGLAILNDGVRVEFK